MSFYIYLLFCLVASVTVIQAQLLPSSISCDHSRGPAITRDDCKKALSSFDSESNVAFWTHKINFHSCGTCKITITKPSLPHSVHYAAVYGDALTAMHLGLTKCEGKPTNATIGNSEPISVLLEPGGGEKC
ncbi:hypothetical protein MJO28_014747 [Puccinia striiformis f. sp. tritici]|uniref:Uncharacterized protein n=3 Tax=Puccinia striiformis TaxID=27350 RepID=A0A0L0VSL7_9BASI|nr:hypothetical protein Pst134EA_027101 [Puccinia striiformis f. sp. tritici]KAI9624007.1 hypothetical protein H4Q26_017018 [Puccinia striiformis f. sp. tritici PST-130]KNF02274.1 hypothetical protein PSTG_04482 [Puccinia striiformis f. sp. tritici PST-78]POW08027.1 hypothetical protein PSTT_07811 [Puccinia striiformis]KAH9443290.1 hypothetical protein Pst134EB_027637 [Puccinia striiformis f. sp. tritici]KAH9450398.1 hypothetical protein Pst134EA_027101 [Puccinia striiformis f. sp. tritici]